MVTLDTREYSGEWQCRAALLNVSLAGLACRLRAEDAAQLVIGQIVRAGFLIGSGPEPFSLDARVATMTPAGETGPSIAGVEFIDGAGLAEARVRLQAALAAGD